MKLLCAILFAAALKLSAFAEAPRTEEGAHKVLTATTNAYPGERTEIWVQCNAKGELVGVILEEYNLTEPLRDTHRFNLEQVNSAEGVLLKSQLTVTLLTLKGREQGLGPAGGPVDLDFRKSNWFSDHGTFPLYLKRDRDTWRAYSPDPKGKVVNALSIQVWTGFGFGIDEIRMN